jgi:S1-C subfamily serine protease
MKEDIAARVKAATVRLPGGQGVLVSSGHILTAMHCIAWQGDAGLVLGNYHLVPIQCADGTSFRAAPVFADVVSDMAALGEADGQMFYDDAIAFEEWRADVRPVEVRLDALALRQPIPVYVLTCRGRWTRGTVTNHGNEIFATVGLQTSEAIESGTSGGPVVDEAGRLVGVVSFSSGRPDGGHNGGIPAASAALPGWLLALLAR